MKPAIFLSIIWRICDCNIQNILSEDLIWQIKGHTCLGGISSSGWSHFWRTQGIVWSWILNLGLRIQSIALPTALSFRLLWLLLFLICSTEITIMSMIGFHTYMFFLHTLYRVWTFSSTTVSDLQTHLQSSNHTISNISIEFQSSKNLFNIIKISQQSPDLSKITVMKILVIE